MWLKHLLQNYYLVTQLLYFHDAKILYVSSSDLEPDIGVLDIFHVQYLHKYDLINFIYINISSTILIACLLVHNEKILLMLKNTSIVY